jgi:hypothetical protein
MRSYRSACSALLAFSVTWLPAVLSAYPLDGYQETGIRRVEGSRLANEALAIGGFQPPGALLTTEQVVPRLLDHRGLTLPPPDAGFTAQIAALLGDDAGRYGLAVLDLTDPDRPVYAEHRGDYRQNTGSVGKILAALGYFQALADTWPDDLEQRKAILRNTIITADDFAHSDHHNVRFFDVEKRFLTRRKIRDGDQASAWEYLDWTLSVSSNSAASMVMRDAMLLRRFGPDYPIPDPQIDAFFAGTQQSELTRLFQRTFWEPVTRNGLDLSQIRQGSFFTAQGKRKVSGGGNSYGTARSLVQLMLLMEQGMLVDEWTSTELKRLLYVTERRIRYASSPALKNAAVYFKSGSFYKCREEPGFSCRPYHGNVTNYMNSVVIVEQEIDGVPLRYIAAVLSNVLRMNAAQVHQALGTEVHQLMLSRHGLTRTSAAASD